MSKTYFAETVPTATAGLYSTEVPMRASESRNVAHSNARSEVMAASMSTKLGTLSGEFRDLDLIINRLFANRIDDWSVAYDFGDDFDDEVEFEEVSPVSEVRIGVFSIVSSGRIEALPFPED